MTTTQEIIDYLNNNVRFDENEYNNYEDCDELTKMIKNLKPEIKVKGIMWSPSSSTSLCGKYYWDDIDGYVSAYSRYDGETNYLGLFDYVNQAQEACQKHWDEYVLSLVEVE